VARLELKINELSATEVSEQHGQVKRRRVNGVSHADGKARNDEQVVVERLAHVYGQQRRRVHQQRNKQSLEVDGGWSERREQAARHLGELPGRARPEYQPPVTRQMKHDRP